MIVSDYLTTGWAWPKDRADTTASTWLDDASSTTGRFTFNPAGSYRITAADLADYIPAKLPAGARTIELPDGAKLILDDAGNYRIEDQDAQVTYRAHRVREFSPHLNASDLLAQFVKYVGSLGVRQTEVLGLPIELFINWLIIEAAERDGDPVGEDVVRVEEHREIKRLRKPKCLACGKFIPRAFSARRFPFCGPEHAQRYLDKANPEWKGRALLTGPAESRV